LVSFCAGESKSHSRHSVPHKITMPRQSASGGVFL
jgi:hypothetical protein